MTEAQIEHDIRLDLGLELDLCLWRNSTGAVKVDKRWQRFGLCVGSSDLIGILGPHGRFFALEIKSATGRLSEEQRMFMELVRRLGGFAAVVRSIDEARAALERARAGASE